MRRALAALAALPWLILASVPVIGIAAAAYGYFILPTI